VGGWNRHGATPSQRSKCANDDGTASGSLTRSPPGLGASRVAAVVSPPLSRYTRGERGVRLEAGF